MKKFGVFMMCLLLSMVAYTFAAQELSVSCSGGTSVTVSNVPDSMTSADLNADYRCPKNGGIWLVTTGDVVATGDVALSGDVTLSGDVVTTTGDVVTTGDLVATGDVDVSVVIERSASGLVVLHVQDAIDYLFVNGLTMYGTEDTFMGASSLRRDEAAAFFARFARDVLGMEVDTEATGCEFTDLAGAHQDLLGEVAAACQLGLFKGFEGEFMPTASLTNEEALTVLVRLIDGDKEEVAGDWSAHYYAFAQEAGLTATLDADFESNLSVAITRADVAKLIEAGSAYVKVEGIAGETRGDPHENLNGDAIDGTGSVVTTGSIDTGTGTVE